MTDQDKTKLWNEMNRKRKELNDAYAADENAEKVLMLSRKLDELLNQYDHLMKSESNEQ